MAAAIKLLTVVGARPQIIKAAAISRAIANSFVGAIGETILHTGQHYDDNMSEVFFRELGIPGADVQLNAGSGGHGAQTARMIDGVEAQLLKYRPDVVLLYGDTNSTLAGAVAAAKLHIPVAHLEAGLRSWNKAMPEEINRITCDHCSTWLFCPTETAVKNLEREGIVHHSTAKPNINAPAVHMVGDVMFDNSMHFAGLASKQSSVLGDLGLTKDGFALATIHRDHNTDVPEHMNAIFQALLSVAEKHQLPLVLPVHPRLRKCMDSVLDPNLRTAVEGSKRMHLIPPVGFLDMIELERNARLVFTDSGGVQKEAFFFNKPCVILRPETEWVELVEHGHAVLAGADANWIAAATDRFLSQGIPASPPLFGDGRAAQRVCEVLVKDLG
ncbi:MAG: UDP-N-acetylglucosamine 2-epimerase (non-hydrolyzing) [Flavobacteriales bacterium]|nr:UDP-N-acetylglucosamine 2-epimerase (non-hydrolyzing) [Flavobacteriales bacterium]